MKLSRSGGVLILKAIQDPLKMLNFNVFFKNSDVYMFSRGGCL